MSDLSNRGVVAIGAGITASLATAVIVSAWIKTAKLREQKDLPSQQELVVNRVKGKARVERFNKLGSSDLLVSDACLGTMTMGSLLDEETSHAILDAFYNAGGNFLDTAELYPVPMQHFPKERGFSEIYIGNWMKKKGAGFRETVIITTKVSGPSSGNATAANRTDPNDPDTPNPHVNKKNIMAAVQGSLRRLQTSYIDLLLIHWPERPAPTFGNSRFDPNQKPTHEEGVTSFDEQVLAIGELIKEKKIRHWGLSNETTFGVCRFCEACDRLGVPRPVAIQNDFSVISRRFETELAEACAPGNFNIGLTPYGVLAGGALSGKYLADPNAKGRLGRFRDFQQRYVSEQSKQATREYCKLANKAGITPSQLAQAWSRSRWYVPSTIIGASNLEQLEENLQAFQMELSDKLLAEIDEIHYKCRNPTSQD